MPRGARAARRSRGSGRNPYLFWQAELSTAARNTTWSQAKSLYR